jgi:uncharacterized protein (TIGR03435 family)
MSLQNRRCSRFAKYRTRSGEGIVRTIALGRTLSLSATETSARVLLILFGLLSAMPSAAAPQTENPSPHPPAYDVASIKPGKSGDGSTLLFRLDGFTAKGMTLKSLMKEAYGIEDDQISGAPKWVNSETYDIEAKVDGADSAELERLSEDQRHLMFQSFLMERFKLKVHWETKELPILALVVAKGGPKLQQAKPGDTYPNGIKGLDGKAGGHAGMMMWGRGRLTGQGIPIASMVPPLTQQLGRIVQDKTGLTGKYDVELRWTDDTGPDTRPASDPAAPSIFTAIQEQLGLKLDSQKAPVEVLVIDHVDAPSAN